MKDGQPYRLVLASQSPRRQRLLEGLRLEFETVAPGIDEAGITAASHRARVMAVASAKAQAVARKLPFGDASWLVLAADTVVVLDDEALGKPADREAAAAMLERLSGRAHQVVTGVALRGAHGRFWIDADRSEVTFRPLEDAVIQRYVRSGEADDKAGAYGVQEVGATFIERIEGDLSNVIGLPLGRLREGFKVMLGRNVLEGQSLRRAVMRAFPDLAGLPAEHWLGIPD